MLIAATVCTVTHADIARAQAGTVVHIGRLPPGDAREAWRGIISPDGRLFAYEVVHVHYRRIWILDVASGTARLLTPEPAGISAAPAWSPDGRHVAYVKNNNAIHVVTASGDSDHVVFAVVKTSRFSTPYLDAPRWLSDSEVAFRNNPELLSPQPVPWWRVTMAGVNPGPLADEPVDDHLWRPTYRFCCGGDKIGLWLDAPHLLTTRCLAGPLTYGGSRVWWDATGTILYVVVNGHLYAAPVPDGPARRAADPVPDHLASVSATRDGRFALVVLAPKDSVGDLWIAHPPIAVTGDTLPRCLAPPASITHFVIETAGVPYWVAMADSAPRFDFRLFTAAYPGFDVRRVILGVQYGHRFGWLGGDHVQFPVASTDSALYGAALDSTLDGQNAELADLWRRYLLSQPTVPPAALTRLAERHPELAETIAENLLSRAAIRRDPAALLAVAQLPRVWNADGPQDSIASVLAELGPAIAQDPASSEPLLFALALSGTARNLSTALQRLILEHPVARQSERTVAVIAVLAPGSAASVEAQQILGQRGTTVQAQLADLVAHADSTHLWPVALSTLVAGRLVVNRDVSIQLAAAALTDSAYAAIRRDARGQLGVIPTTPLPVLRRLAQTLDPRHERGLAVSLARNPRAQADPETAAALAAIGITPSYGIIR